MSLLKKIGNFIKFVLTGDPKRKYPDTYLQELEYQCILFTRIICIAGMFAWLRFVAIDKSLHPDKFFLPYLRYGLTGLSIICLLATFTKIRYKGIISLSIIGAYVLIATAYNSAVTGMYPYVTSYILFIAVSMAAPLPRYLTFSISVVSFIFFLVFCHLNQIDLSLPHNSYILTNLSNSLFLLLFGIYVLDRARHRSYLKSKEIEKKEAESNRLLLNILPETIALELKASGSTKPIRIAEATVMFTDFVGFTRISEKLSPEAVVEELDKCFSYFDQVTEKYGLEKLKTIGDSYMCAGGLPTTNKTHAVDCCLAALEIQSFMNQMKEIKKQRGFDYWELRLGIHTGPLVAGVVGHKKFAYDIWGDTVNTASRLESSGLAGRINISFSTYQAVKAFFECDHRGKVKAKNKGEIDMYFLNGIHAKLSVNDENHIPNAQFKEKYSELQRRSDLR